MNNNCFLLIDTLLKNNIYINIYILLNYLNN